MLPAFTSPSLPHYQGLKWLQTNDLNLPETTHDWLDCSKHGLRQRKTGSIKSRQSAESLLQEQNWKWPQQQIVFISDLHADGHALLASLVASGGIRKTGKADHHFKLTDQGKSMLFIFGGDFLDKGPSNLHLLRVLRLFIETGARVRLLAGNHDIRILFGMRCVNHTDDPWNGHFFVRMGAKGIPFLREIRDEFLTKEIMKDIPDKQTCMKRMFPSKEWWEKFPELAARVMPTQSIEQEMKKTRYKADNFEALCEKAGLTLREAYAAAIQWQKLFLDKEGEFYWFFKRMRLASHKGSFLFIHAGIDDRLAEMLRNHDIAYLNKQFKQQLRGSAFEFYYGAVGNAIRTKYRRVNMQLTQTGAEHARSVGIHAIVHGHRNLRRGQRIALRKKIFHFECDITLNASSRRKEGFDGAGAGATLIRPEGYILGISNDYHAIKLFHPRSIMKTGKKNRSGADVAEQ